MDAQAEPLLAQLVDEDDAGAAVCDEEVCAFHVDEDDGEEQVAGLGRKSCLEEKYGDSYVNWLRNYIESHGQVQIEPHRLKSTGQVYGTPLRHLEERARVFGWGVSYNGSYNLLAPPRRNSRGSCRGVIDARPSSIRANTQKFNARDMWSATLFKYHKQLFTVVASVLGGSSQQADMEDMAKIPEVVAARSKATAGGFVCRRADGKAEFTQLDHDFVVGSRLLLNTTGISLSNTPTEPTVVVREGKDTSKTQLLTSRPVSLHCTARCVRYWRPNTLTHMAPFNFCI